MALASLGGEVSEKTIFIDFCIFNKLKKYVKSSFTSSLDISLKLVAYFLMTKKLFLIFHRNLIFWNVFSVIILL